MTTPDKPISAIDLRVGADYGQIMIYSDPAVDWEAAFSALDDAWDNERFIGTAGGLVDLLTPGTRNAETAMRVEVWTAEPPADTEEWFDEVDVDLDVPDGRLVFQAPESGGQIPVEVPAGSYRARVCGAGYTETVDAGADGDDFYRLRLWPRDRRRPGRPRPGPAVPSRSPPPRRAAAAQGNGMGSARIRPGGRAKFSTAPRTPARTGSRRSTPRPPPRGGYARSA